MAIVVDIRDEYDPDVPPATPGLPAGSVEIDGLLHIEDLPEAVPGLDVREGSFDTVGGFVMDRLQRMPRLGDRILTAHHELTVTALDGHRVARVVVTPRPQHPDEREHPRRSA